MEKVGTGEDNDKDKCVLCNEIRYLTSLRCMYVCENAKS